MKGVKEQRLLKDERGKPGELLAEARPAREESPNHFNAYVGILEGGGRRGKGGREICRNRQRTIRAVPKVYRNYSARQ